MADVEAVEKRLLSNQGSSPLSRALQQRKTIRVGNRSDPFQECEIEHQVSSRLIQFLMAHKWDTVIKTKYPQRAWDMTGLGKHCILMAEVTVGLEEDWEMFEYRKTENPLSQIQTLAQAQQAGFRVGVTGEPFIPGYHTVEQFRDVLKLLKSHGLQRYNVYNLHLNDLVAKNLHALGLDIERIWYMNQDKPWRRILRQLLEAADQYDVILGNPDFVNSGWLYKERANTCCGLDVQNPCTFNTHHFKLAIQDGRDPLELWDGVGDYNAGIAVLDGSATDKYTMKDVVEEESDGIQLL